jgi:hypothetical protein
MKISRLQQFFAFLAILAVSLSCSVQAVTITVSPSSISNLYQGYVTLMVTNGLTNGETVLIEKFVDYNTNGAVDADDMLVQTLRPGDGQANVFGGVTNMNSPGDLTPTNGAITTVISFYGTHPGKFIGNYIFRVSSPTGNFSPATTPFTVTNSNFGQAISGAVRNNGTNVPYGGVVVLGGLNQNLIGGTFADSAGNFTYKAAPGTYFIGGLKSGYVLDFSTASQVTLSSGVDATADANATAATRTISGTVRELGNPTNALGGVEINGEAQNAFVLAFSDSNGNFTMPVTADVWKLKLQDDLVALMGYVTPDQEPARPLVDATGGSVSGVNIDLPKVNALFYGNLKTSSNTPLVGITVGANGSSGGSSYPYNSRGNTDSNGDYFLGVVATNWFVGPDSDTLSALGYSTSGTNTSINAGQAIQINFTAQSLTVHLGGRVVNNNGDPIGDIQLTANDQMGGNFSGRTDNDGYFNIGLTAGTWNLQLEMQDAANRGLIGPSLVFSNLVDGANITNILYVAQNATAHITGNVHDTNSNPITFVNVFANITVSGTNYLSGGQTDGGGNYSMGVFNGTWSAGVSGDDLSGRGLETPTNQTVTISGSDVILNFTVYPIQPLQITTASLPLGVISRNYHTNLQATGGQQPYNWSLVSGSLPPGVIFNSGLIDGIPTNSGTFNFTVQVNDQQGSTTNKSFSITINPALQITTVSLPNGTNGQSYSANLAASGGVTPYNWSTSGPLPAGLNLSTNGVISGTPTGSGTNFFTVSLNDSSGSFANQNFSIAINLSGSNPAPSFISFGNNANGRFEMLIQGVVGRSYRFEGSTTLTSNSWVPLQTSSSNPGDGRVYFQDTNSPGFNYRFYRAVLLP